MTLHNKKRNQNSTVSAVSDSYHIQSSGVLSRGIVKAFVPGINAYVVTTVSGNDRRAVASGLGYNPVGVKNFNAYQPGTSILVWFETPYAQTGIIVAAIPTETDISFAETGNTLSLATSGFPFDSYYRMLAGGESEEEVPYQNLNRGCPWDLVGGESANINFFNAGVLNLATGTKITAGLAECSVSMIDNRFYTFAETYVKESPTLEEKHINDQGSAATIKKFTPYLWEGLGQKDPKTEAYKEDTEYLLEPDNKNEEKVGVFQLEKFNAKGLFRFLSIEGLGSILKEYVKIPEEGGVYSNQIDLDGFVLIQTAKGITLQKTTNIPVPEEKLDSWDPEGNKDEDIDFGHEELVEGEDYEFDWKSDLPVERSAEVDDYVDFRANVQNNHTLRQLDKDWEIEEKNLVEEEYEITPLSGKFSAPLPPAREDVRVDHKRKKVKYYAGKSSVSLLDDGSIYLRDAYGSAIVMSGGNVEIQPRNHLILRPGASIIGLAPKDIAFNAQDSVELSSSRADVRVKAENNMQLLSGNSGQGGMLIENRADDKDGQINNYNAQGVETISSGIVFKAENAPLVSFSSVCMLQTSSNFIIDSASHNGDVKIFSENLDLTAKNKVGLRAGVDPSRAGTESSFFVVDRNNLVSETQSARTVLGSSGFQVSAKTGSITTVFRGRFEVDGAVAVTGDAQIRGGLLTNFASKVGGGEWGTLDAPPNVRISDDITRDLTLEVVKEWEEDFRNTRSQYYIEENFIGNKKFLSDMQFSFNPSSYYWADDNFVLASTAWQTEYQKHGGTTWIQPIVKFKDIETVPWPGIESWTGNTFKVRDNKELQKLEDSYIIDPGI